MSMWRVIGQKRAVGLLEHSLAKGQVAHAYLLVGPPHVGKMTLALDIAEVLNCTASAPPCGDCPSCQRIAAGSHADVQVIALGSNVNGEGKAHAEISIDRIREMQHVASLPPFEGKSKVFIIAGAEYLSLEAANCLLKTLEEPAAKVIFLLLTANERLLPGTVVSRCQRLELAPLPVAEIETALQERWGMPLEKARLLARLAHGCLGWAVSATLDDRLLQARTERLAKLGEIIDDSYETRFGYAAQLAAQFGDNREAVFEVLDLWLDWWRDLLLAKISNGDMITNIDITDSLKERAALYSVARIRSMIGSIQSAREQLKLNANHRLVLEVLMLDMPGQKEVK
ncbi:MAG: DNA polymerase III subunit [Chloroflexi bacterium]|nr:DNA polymerase III subunit [Chloroflexota bacterium]